VERRRGGVKCGRRNWQDGLCGMNRWIDRGNEMAEMNELCGGMHCAAAGRERRGDRPSSFNQCAAATATAVEQNERRGEGAPSFLPLSPRLSPTQRQRLNRLMTLFGPIPISPSSHPTPVHCSSACSKGGVMPMEYHVKLTEHRPGVPIPPSSSHHCSHPPHPDTDTRSHPRRYQGPSHTPSLLLACPHNLRDGGHVPMEERDETGKPISPRRVSTWEGELSITSRRSGEGDK